MSIGEKYLIIGLCSGSSFYYGKPSKNNPFTAYVTKPVSLSLGEFHLIKIERANDDILVTLQNVATKRTSDNYLKVHTMTKSGKISRRQVYNKPLINAVYKALGRKRVRAIKEEWSEFFPHSKKE